jgi:phosphoglycolate phosphatase
MSENNNYDVVIFDMDGTLCDTREAIVTAMQATLEKVGAPERSVSRTAIEQQVAAGSTLSQVFAALSAAALEPQELEHRIGVYRELYVDIGVRHTRLYPGVEPAIEALRARGVACVVLSNKGETALRRTLRHLNVEANFALIVGEQRNLAVKPSPDIFLQLIRPQFPATALRRFLMVGDTEADIRFAANAGIASCWAQYGYGIADACRLLSPDHRIEAIGQLPDLVSANAPQAVRVSRA